MQQKKRHATHELAKSQQSQVQVQMVGARAFAAPLQCSWGHMSSFRDLQRPTTYPVSSLGSHGAIRSQFLNSYDVYVCGSLGRWAARLRTSCHVPSPLRCVATRAFGASCVYIHARPLECLCADGRCVVHVQKRAAATAPVHEAKSLDDFSPVQAARLSYVPRVPEVLTTTLHLVAQAERSTAASSADVEALAAHLPKLFGSPLVQFPSGHAASGGAGSGAVPAAGPLRVAIVFCGRQTPGAHNVVWGLFSALKRLSADNEVLGG